MTTSIQTLENKHLHPTTVMHRYVAMYVNGLGTPIEVAFMSDQALNEKDTQILQTVEEFIRRSIDLDIRKLHFIFEDASTPSLTPLRFSD